MIKDSVFKNYYSCIFLCIFAKSPFHTIASDRLPDPGLLSRSRAGGPKADVAPFAAALEDR